MAQLTKVVYTISDTESITIENHMLHSTMERGNQFEDGWNGAVDAIEALLLNLYERDIVLPNDVVSETFEILSNKLC